MTMKFFEDISTYGKQNHPKGNQVDVQYGTAGFRTKAEVLDHVMFRMGVLATLRSKVKQGAVIGVMITASHNAAPDNGVKLVDPAGEMLEQSWEIVATKVANSKDGELAKTLAEVVQDFSIDLEVNAKVFVGCDTRPSSQALRTAVLDGVATCRGNSRDFGVVTTPQLHHFVVSDNTGGASSADEYYDKLAVAFTKFMGQTICNGKYEPNICFDGANGVGAIAMQGLLEKINGVKNGALKATIFNDDTKNPSLLNSECGADFVKVQQKPGRGMTAIEKNVRCVSVDGDADRVVYFYLDDQGKFGLLDGDRIATLIAGYIKELLAESGLEDLNLGLVQTAYANGSSTEYITSKLGVPVACVATGVKHLHHKAKDFDIGVYFEANGHGTVLYSQEAQKAIRGKSGSGSGQKLNLFMDMTNQCVGDALSDMLLVESVLFARGWNISDWHNAYKDLPNRQLKVRVADRTVIKTTDAERCCSNPAGLQEKINETVAKFTKARSFVRPSGTEDVVRVYAEAATQGETDQLAYEVGLIVHKMAGGVGEPTPKP